MIIDTTKSKLEQSLHICPYVKGGGLRKECGKFWRRIGDSEMYTCNYDDFNEVLGARTPEKIESDRIATDLFFAQNKDLFSRCKIMLNISRRGE